MLLSPHFSYEELIHSAEALRHGISNVPGPQQLANLRALANAQLEDCRAIVGPMHVDSGYRSPPVNKLVGGALTSQHMDGNACDWVPQDPASMTIQEAYEAILNSSVAYDQLIYEFGAWVHVSRAPDGHQPRHMAIMIGSWTDHKYVTYDPSLIPT
jgi:zinc D-Ala-D-Ala carboxypeptidase